MFCLPSSKPWGSCSHAGERNVAVSSLFYCTVRLAQWVSADGSVASRRGDVSLAASPCMTWCLSYSFFPSDLLQQLFIDSAGGWFPFLHSAHWRELFSIDHVIKSSCRFYKLPGLNVKCLGNFLISISCICLCHHAMEVAHFQQKPPLLPETPKEQYILTLCLNQLLEEQYKFRVKEVQSWAVYQGRY